MKDIKDYDAEQDRKHQSHSVVRDATQIYLEEISLRPLLTKI